MSKFTVTVLVEFEAKDFEEALSKSYDTLFNGGQPLVMLGTVRTVHVQQVEE